MSSILKVDQLQDSGGTNLVTSNGSGVITSAGFGKIGQIVQSTYSTQTTINTTTYTDTGLTGTITPSSTSSKILVEINLQGQIQTTNQNTGMYYGLKFFRGTTEIFDPNGSNATGPFTIGWDSSASNSGNLYGYTTLKYLDSPASSSALTYKIQARVYEATNSMNVRFQRDGAVTAGNSIMTLMEILP